MAVELKTSRCESKYYVDYDLASPELRTLFCANCGTVSVLAPDESESHALIEHNEQFPSNVVHAIARVQLGNKADWIQ